MWQICILTLYSRKLNSRGNFTIYSFGITSDPVTYTNWITGIKSNYASHTVEDCVTFLPYNQGKWDDIPSETRVNVLLLQVIR